jgi:hypothetical protein
VRGRVQVGEGAARGVRWGECGGWRTRYGRCGIGRRN